MTRSYGMVVALAFMTVFSYASAQSPCIGTASNIATLEACQAAVAPQNVVAENDSSGSGYPCRCYSFEDGFYFNTFNRCVESASANNGQALCSVSNTVTFSQAICTEFIGQYCYAASTRLYYLVATGQTVSEAVARSSVNNTVTFNQPATPVFQPTPATASPTQGFVFQPATPVFQPTPATASVTQFPTQGFVFQPATPVFRPTPATASPTQGFVFQPATPVFRPTPATAFPTQGFVFQPTPPATPVFNPIPTPSYTCRSLPSMTACRAANGVCGAGSASSSGVCIDSRTQQTVAASNCPNGCSNTIPCSVPCPTQPPLEYACVISGIQCSTTCGSGIATTTYTCMASDGSTNPAGCGGGCSVPLNANAQSQCQNANCPAPERTCPCETYEIQCRETPCPRTATCGVTVSAQKTRTCGCVKLVGGATTGTPVDCCYCGGTGCTTTREPCPAVPPCQQYRCQPGSPSACSVSCGTGGVRMTQQTCLVMDVMDGRTGNPQPAQDCKIPCGPIAELCPQPACAISECSCAPPTPCTGTCGPSGTSNVQCTCRNNGQVVPNDQCGVQCQSYSFPCPTLPPCKTYRCEISELSGCSATQCGTSGTQTRSATCTSFEVVNGQINLATRQQVALSFCDGTSQVNSGGSDGSKVGCGCKPVTKPCQAGPCATCTNTCRQGTYGPCSLTCRPEGSNAQAVRTASPPTCTRSCTLNGRQVGGAQQVSSSFCSNCNQQAPQPCTVPICITYREQCSTTPCTLTCGCNPGVSTRTCSCVSSQGQTVQAGLCPGMVPRSATPCPSLPPCYSYNCQQTTQPCPTGCIEDGVAQSVSVTQSICVQSAQPPCPASTSQVSDSMCGSCPAPATRQCNQPLCPKYRCSCTNQGSCSTATCGVQTGSLSTICGCVDERTGQPVPSTLCEAAGQQCRSSQTPCPALPCCPTYRCQQGPFGSCSTTCGAGVRVAQSVCIQTCGGQSQQVFSGSCGNQVCQDAQQPCSVCPPGSFRRSGSGSAPATSATASFHVVDGQCKYGASPNVYPCSLCAGMSGCTNSKKSHVLTAQLPQSAPANSSKMLVALSVCGGLMVVAAMVASSIIVVRHLVRRGIAEELKRLDAA